MRSLFRILAFALKSVWRNAWLSLVTLSVFVLTLVTVYVVVFFHVLAEGAVRSVEDRVTVSVYFTPGASEDIQGALRSYVLGLPQVKTVDVVTAEEALLDFRADHAENPTVIAALEEVGGNPFGGALRIQAYDTEDFSFILDAVERPEFTDVIKETTANDYEDAITTLTHIAERIRAIGLALAAFFTSISVLMVFNAIRVAIYVHREEIGIMKLVGAPDWFIRAPFVVEVSFLALVASGIVTGAVLFVAKTFDAPLATYLGGTVHIWTFFTENALPIFGGTSLALVGIAVVTTMTAMRTHLRV